MGERGAYLAQAYMLTPAIAAILTRLFFYEPGFKDANLRFGRPKDYLKFWLFSLGLTALFLLAFPLSWGVWIPPTLAAKGWLSFPIPDTPAQLSACGCRVGPPAVGRQPRARQTPPEFACGKEIAARTASASAPAGLALLTDPRGKPVSDGEMIEPLLRFPGRSMRAHQSAALRQKGLRKVPL